MQAKCGGTSGSAITVLDVAKHLKKLEEEQSGRSKIHASGNFLQPMVFKLIDSDFIS